MKKFYIPTSTLNFNNILSSESISPKAFYEKRGFGYSRWAIVPENPFDNVIVLYKDLFFFERPKSDMEDYPLLIEVVLDEANLQQADGFWYSDHSLYLSPTTTRFLFYAEKEKTITLSMSESSLETKLMRLYSRQFQTIQKPAERYRLITACEPCVLNELDIEKDVRINKMKGMLYGYYIGSLLSSDLNSVKYLNALKEIHNIFAAILSSFEKRPTAYQNEKLDVLFDYLNEQNADYLSLYEIINSSSLDAKSKAKTIWAWFLSRRGSLQYGDKNYWLSCLQYASEKDERENQAITWIKRRIGDAKRQMQTNRQLLSSTDGELVVMDNNVFVLKNTNIANNMDNKLCISWLNETLSDNSTNGKISTYKEELAKNLTLKAKEVYQELWERSQTRTYLNDLRRHLAGEEFKHEWNNGLLSSIAGVLIAGDDWEKLLVFMQNKEMTDYKLAFAFYGTLNGFANLTRDFTDILYGQDKNYVWEVYKEFHGQLLGENLNIYSGNMKPLSHVIMGSEKKHEVSTGGIIKPVSSESIVSEKKCEEVEGLVKATILKLEKSKCGIKKDKINLIAELYQKRKDNPSMFLNEVGRVNGIGKKTVEKIMSVLEICPVVENELFDDVSLITQLDCSKGLDVGKKEQLIYWWKVAQKKFPDNKDKAINYFINLCKKEGRGESNPNYQALKGYFTQEIADQYEKELKMRYDLQ